MHTHPQSAPFPGTIDLSGVALILFQDDCNREKNALLIIQPKNERHFVLGSFLFTKADFEKGCIRILDSKQLSLIEAK